MSRGVRIYGAELDEILIMLASGEAPQRIADQFERPVGTITNLKCRNRAEIQAIKQKQSDQLSKIWIMQKLLRAREMADLYDILSRQLDQEMEKEEPNQRVVLSFVSQMQSMMKQAAEENGDLPTRLPNEGKPGEPPEWRIHREKPDE